VTDRIRGYVNDCMFMFGVLVALQCTGWWQAVGIVGALAAVRSIAKQEAGRG
jgi:hypothetical protein